MKVALAICYYYPNYGSMLQAYATQEAVKKLGCDYITLHINMPINYMPQSKAKYYFHKLTNPEIIKTHWRQYQGRQKLKKYPEIKKGIETRNKCFKEFSQTRFKLTDLLPTKQSLTEYVKNQDCVLVGSDQLWSPANVEHDYYTLGFVPDNVKKISYATSIGTRNIPKYQIDTYKHFLSRFSSISVREKSAVDIIKKMGFDSELVLDPTLLFTGEEWLSIQQKEPIVKEPYVLCYLLGTTKWHRSMISKIAEKYGCKIVALQQLDEFNEDDVNFGDDQRYDVGPAEFINLIRNAQIVCTDSFHGTCFSILNHKQFFTMNRFSDSEKLSTNTRIDSLLGQLRLNERRINDYSSGLARLSSEDLPIDYSSVDEKLMTLRESSFDYLRNAFGVSNDR